MVAITGRPIPPPKPSRLQPPGLPEFSRAVMDDPKCRELVDSMRALHSWAVTTGQYLNKAGMNQTQALAGDIARDAAVDNAFANLSATPAAPIDAQLFEPTIPTPDYPEDAQKIIAAEEFGW